MIKLSFVPLTELRALYANMQRFRKANCRAILLPVTIDL